MEPAWHFRAFLVFAIFAFFVQVMLGFIDSDIRAQTVAIQHLDQDISAAIWAHEGKQ